VKDLTAAILIALPVTRIVVLAGNESNIRVYVDCRSVNVRDSIDDVTVTESTLDEHERHLKWLLDAASSCNITLNKSETQHRSITLDVLGQCF